MKTQRMLLPRKLEEEGTAGKIAEVLDRHKARPWPGAEAEVPVLKLSRALEQAIRKARLQRRVRPGFEDIANKLAAEQKGLAGIRPSSDGATATRISRLLLFSNDGAPRLYRHIEQLYKQHLSLIHISEPTRLLSISYAVFCLKKKKKKTHPTPPPPHPHRHTNINTIVYSAIQCQIYSIQYQL